MTIFLLDEVFHSQGIFSREEYATCLLRSWIEEIPISVQYRVHLPPKKSKQAFPKDLPEHYRLTSEGWVALWQTHALLVATFWVTALTLFVTLLELFLRLL